MPEVPAATPAPQVQPAAPAAPAANGALFAGKYTSPDELQKGIREAWKKSGIPGAPADGVNLIGQGAMFATTEEAEAGYKKFETLITTPAATPKPAAAAPAGPALPQITQATEEPTAGDELDTMTLLAKSGLSEQDVFTEFAKEGKLSDEHVAKFRATDPSLKNVSRKLLNEHFALVHQVRSATIQRVVSDAHQLAGGPEKFQIVMQWAAGKYKGDDLANINRMLADPRTTVAATKVMLHDYAAANGFDGTHPLIGGSPGEPVGKPTNARDLGALMNRVYSGDQNAIRTLNSMTPQELESIR